MAIDRKRIIQALSQIDVVGNDDGLVPAYGVYITQLPARFWNSFAERLSRRVPEDLLPAAEWLLVNAAQECGYHTGYGIITSEEWQAVVAPMIENPPEDVLHGAFAVFTAWGWGKAQIVDLVPEQHMVVRAYDYYEADVVAHGHCRKPSAYMIRGVSAAFMDLAYGGDYDPSGATGLRTFECGDDYGEFVVRRA